MKIYKYISTLKSKDGTGNKPTHYLVAKTEQTQDKGDFVAALWAKEYTNQAGEAIRFLSGEMKATFTDRNDPTKSRKGFVIVEEDALNQLLIEVKRLKGEVLDEDLPEEARTSDGSLLPSF